jgi:hypothetical protein
VIEYAISAGKVLRYELEFGLPENKKSNRCGPQRERTNLRLFRTHHICEGELLSSMARTAKAQEGTQPEKHGTKKRYNL